MRKTVSMAALICLVVAGSRVLAEVKVHGLFTDNMVLQQGMKVPVWGTADKGEKVAVCIAGQEVQAIAKDGKWTVWLKPLEAGGPLEMTVRGQNTIALKNVLVGEVWVCSGQSNMAMQLNGCANAQDEIAKSANPKLRLFTVERTTSDKPLSAVNTKSGWVECGPKTTGGFSAVAYFFGRDLQPALKVPVGLIHTSWGGSPAESWTDRQTLESTPQLERIFPSWHWYMKNEYPKRAKAYQAKLAKWKQEAARAKAEGKKPPRRPRAPAGPNSHRRPCSLYNAMIHPLLPYAIRGAIWYQGEANAGRAYEYRTLFPAMITCWRKVWAQGDFPFLLVQLAPFEGKSRTPTWPELREAQLLTTQKLPKVGMAVITDVGDRADIHPNRKAPVGARLALAARAIAYGEKIVHSGPVYESMKVEGDAIVLSFKHVGSGLMAKSGKLTGFTICGKDRKFVPAQAKIQGDKVLVSSPTVAEPVAVRFGWENFPVVDFWNKDGLPATPFRTDDFPMITKPK
jgi:sialate O-acetylesterase